MSFDVRRIMEEYLGDVQIVTEFSYYRNDIVGRFHSAMQAIHDLHGEADIYIVAHSEGTVVSFLGLLHAMSNSIVKLAPPGKDTEKKEDPDPVPAPESPPDWLKNVKGFMTLGSPIDKHLLLWPKLWENFDLRGSKEMTRDGKRARQIKWRNYYDWGDPVGFKLDTARAWLKDHKDQLFEFDEKHDIGFSRYPLPGKAHNDYWEDSPVFEHFIKEAISPREQQPEGKKPKTRPIIWAVSVALPYLLSAALLVLATYISLRGLIKYYAPGSEPLGNYMHYMIMGELPAESYSSWRILGECAGWALLLAGTTVAARLPRLAPKFWPFGVIAILSAFAGYAGTLLINGEILTMLIDDSVAGQWPPRVRPSLRLAAVYPAGCSPRRLAEMEQDRRRQIKGGREMTRSFHSHDVVADSQTSFYGRIPRNIRL